jgi:hypothetical protein
LMPAMFGRLNLANCSTPDEQRKRHNERLPRTELRAWFSAQNLRG